MYKKYKRKYKGGAAQAAQAAQTPLEWDDRKARVLELIQAGLGYTAKYKGDPTEPAEYTSDLTSEDLEGRLSKCVGESDFSAGCYIEQLFDVYFNKYGEKLTDDPIKGYDFLVEPVTPR